VGRRGPPSKPFSLHILDGTKPPRRPSTAPSAALGPLGNPPDWFTSEQAAAWRETAAQASHLTVLDRGLFAALAVAITVHKAASIALQAEGLVLARKSGGEYPHPATKVLAQQAGLVLSLSSALALTPRARIGIEAVKPRSKWDGIID